MKRIIALALSILLGSTGYVIVDHTIENRVGVLESQVESLNGVVSSLEDKHQTRTLTMPTVPTVPINTTTTSRKQTTSTTTPLETVGAELLPFEDSYQSKYMLRCYSNGRVSYIPTSGSNNITYPHHTTIDNNRTTTQLTYTDTFLYLTDVEAKISSSERYTEPYSYYDSDYSVIYSHYNKLKNEITITFTGNTSADLSGKSLDFDVEFWEDYDHTLSPKKETTITDNTIDSNGNFSFSVVYEFSSSLRGYFDSYNGSTSNGLVKYNIKNLTVS